MKPLLATSIMGGRRFYLVTRYTIRPNGSIVASIKYDVTHWFEEDRGRTCLREDTLDVSTQLDHWHEQVR